ncbi:MAG TPA: fasciclin domain-containing protein [Bacteroidales bacterium]|nr:fasciclin domain-containing protein [Bacteroidales bacterium]
MRRTTKLISGIVLIVGTLLVLSGCKKEIKQYYERPDWLEKPIYPQLAEKGGFDSFLKLIDNSGYKDILSNAGYFTVFAPTDEAFSKYLSDHGLASVDAIDSATAREIVSYLLVPNAYSSDQLDDYQSSALQDWVPDEAFKRRTSNFKWVYDEEVNGSMEKVVDMNAVELLPETPGNFQTDDNNYKHIPYFTSAFMATRNLTSYDYNYFYPNTEFSGFNVVNAKVTEKDLRAENGYIHVIDKVITPLENLEEMLGDNPEYSKFKEVLDKYMKDYSVAPDAFQSRYEQVSGTKQTVYVKDYPIMNFAPNCENFMRYGEGEQYDAQKDGWTMFVPNNAAVDKFFNEKFLKYYKSLDYMSPDLIAEFVNSHLFRTSVWPSKFDVTINYSGEPARFDPESDIVEKKIASNGIFYGTDKVQASDAFYTLLGNVNLNPDYSLFLQALRSTELYYIVRNPNIKQTLFIIPNSAFETLGLSYDGSRNSWSVDNPDLGTNPTVALNRIMNLHIVVNKQLDDLSGTGIVRTSLDEGGEYIRYAGGFVFAAGNAEKSEVIIAGKKSISSNGVSYVLNNALKYSIKNIGAEIEGKSSFSKFYQYLQKSASSLNGYVYDANTKAIANIENTKNNTLLIPNDTAIDAAVRDGYLPEITFADFTQDEQDQLLAFVMYHTISNVIVVPDGEVNGQRETLYKDIDGKTYVTIFNEPDNLRIVDRNNRSAHVINDKSNVLGNRCVIHLIDNYLSY